MSGSGKSTLAEYIKNSLQKNNYKVRIIDGDDIRDNDVKKLGFGRKDVEINNLRIAKLCLKLKDSEVDLVLVPVISPYDEIRKKTRSLLEPYYRLVYVESDIGSLRERDTKGLYKKARAGEIKGFTGIDAPYEAPLKPELIVETDKNDVETCAQIVIDYLLKEKIISRELV